MRDTQREMLKAADELAAAPDHDTLIATVAEILDRLIPADLTFRADVAFDQRPALLVGEPSVRPYGPVLDRLGWTHPDLRSYATDPAGLRPRRLSDLVTRAQWCNSALWDEMFRPLGGLHQLSVIVDFRASSAGTAWIIMRSGSDFTDSDLTVAQLLQPLIVLSERLRPAKPPGWDLGQSPPAPTPREAQVLTLLAQGQTASAIARRCGITPRTVRKHLENVYAKLECSDRLLAVQRARDLGWLTTG